MKKVFSVSGMHCGSCAKIISMELEELPGVKSVNVDYAGGKATVEFDEKKADAGKIVETIKKAGYSAKEQGA